jgi:hypothetical protein
MRSNVADHWGWGGSFDRLADHLAEIAPTP